MITPPLAPAAEEWVEHFTANANRSADSQSGGAARDARDKLYHLLKSLDELVDPAEQSGASHTAERVRTILRARRLRDRFFEAQLFADPAWDILLELYAAELGRYRTSVSSL